MSLAFFANDNRGSMMNLINSLDKYGWTNYTRLGKNMKWEGWITRIKEYLRYCNSLDENEVTILIDAYDVLCLKPPDGIIDKFNREKFDVIYSIENYCSGNCTKLDNWWSNQTQIENNKYFGEFVNAGTVIGRAGKLAKIYQWMIDTNNTNDDQIATGKYFNLFPNDVSLDFNCNYFAVNVMNRFKCDDDNGKLKISLNDREVDPYFIHFPGMSCISSIFLYNIKKPFRTPEYDRVAKIVNGEESFQDPQVNTQIYYLQITGIVVIVIIFILIILFTVYKIYKIRQLAKFLKKRRERNAEKEMQ